MSIGIWQIALIVVVVLLLFGAGKLPRLMGDFAKGIKSFKAGIQDGEAPPPAANQQNASANTAPADESKAIEKEAASTAAESTGAKKDEAAKS